MTHVLSEYISLLNNTPNDLDMAILIESNDHLSKLLSCNDSVYKRYENFRNTTTLKMMLSLDEDALAALSELKNNISIYSNLAVYLRRMGVTSTGKKTTDLAALNKTFGSVKNIGLDLFFHPAKPLSMSDILENQSIFTAHITSLTLQAIKILFDDAGNIKTSEGKQRIDEIAKATAESATANKPVIKSEPLFNSNDKILPNASIKTKNAAHVTKLAKINCKAKQISSVTELPNTLKHKKVIIAANDDYSFVSIVDVAHKVKPADIQSGEMSNIAELLTEHKFIIDDTKFDLNSDRFYQCNKLLDNYDLLHITLDIINKTDVNIECVDNYYFHKRINYDLIIELSKAVSRSIGSSISKLLNNSVNKVAEYCELVSFVIINTYLSLY